MTTVAARVHEDRIEIATDSIISLGTTKVQSSIKQSKIFEGSDVIVGGSGDFAEICLFELFCVDHNIGKKGGILRVLEFLTEFGSWKSNKIGSKTIENSYLIGHRTGCYKTNGLAVFDVTDYAATGHGFRFALAALHLGHSAEASVEVACELDCYSTSPVQTISLHMRD